jgi:hypothetical protein
MGLDVKTAGHCRRPGDRADPGGGPDGLEDGRSPLWSALSSPARGGVGGTATTIPVADRGPGEEVQLDTAG